MDRVSFVDRFGFVDRFCFMVRFHFVDNCEELEVGGCPKESQHINIWGGVSFMVEANLRPFMASLRIVLGVQMMMDRRTMEDDNDGGWTFGVIDPMWLIKDNVQFWRTITVTLLMLIRK